MHELPSVGRVYNQFRSQSTMFSFLLKLARSLLKLSHDLLKLARCLLKLARRLLKLARHIVKLARPVLNFTRMIFKQASSYVKVVLKQKKYA